MTELSGKVALITGASRGIGRAIALELASAGCDIMLTARNGKALEGVAEEIRALGRKAALHAADLTADTEPPGLLDALTRDFGRLDILVNNAGATKRGGFFTQSEQEWRDAFNLKFFAHVDLCRLAWPLLKIGARLRGVHRRHESARACCRLHGRRFGGRRDARLHEGACRSRQARRRSGQRGQSGSVKTDRFRGRLDKVMKKTGLDEAAATERHRQDLDITRFGTPEDIAGMVRFIVSPPGRWLHGTAIDMDGGQVGPLRMSMYD